MYTPIPGYAHLCLFEPRDPIQYSDHKPAQDHELKREASGLVISALEVAAGLRPILHLKPRRFHPKIKLHISAWMRSAGTAERASRCRLISLHTRTDGEFFGSADIAGGQHAFTGVLAAGRLESFRLI